MSPIEDFKTGDLVKVSQKMVEGKRERIISFQGIVTKTRGVEGNKMFTVRQFIEGIGVDRIVPLNLPSLTAVTVLTSHKENRGNLPKKLDLKNSRKYDIK
jgi:large subunit ribosomal protein L19